MAYSALSYRLLKTLSYSKNLQTNTQISSRGELDSYDPFGANTFLNHIGKYLDYKDKTILEIGCGTGDLAITLAKRGAREVVGVDIDRERIEVARHKAASEGVAGSVTFEYADFVNDYQAPRLFDVALNQNAFEHILSPLDCLCKIRACLTPGGVLATLFGPLWLSPYGAHMWGFTPVPWVHLLVPEAVVLKVRNERFRPDEAPQRYEDVRGHLNRITLQKFKLYAGEAGFTIQAYRLNPAQDRGKFKAVNWVINAIGPLQELGAHQLLAVLRNSDMTESESTSQHSQPANLL